MRFFNKLFQAELWLFLFIFAGVFKEAIPSTPIDLTVIFMIITAFFLVRKIRKKPYLNKKLLYPIIIFLCLFLICAVSLFYTPSNDYATSKTIRFLFLTGFTFVSGFILIDSKESLVRLLKISAVTSVVFAFILIFNNIRGDQMTLHRASLTGGNTLGLARLFGLGVISFLCLYFLKRGFKGKLFAGVAIVSLISGIMITGSRMPLIALLISLILILLSTVRFTKRKIEIKKRNLPLIILIPFFIWGISIAYQSGYFTTFFYRLSLIGQMDSASFNERFIRYDSALNMFFDSNMLGMGVGSFGLYYTGMDIADYAHNIFFEVMSELGIVGLMLIIFLIISSFYTAFKNQENVEQLCVLVITMFLFINANVTGDINDNRILFLFLALCFMTPYFNKSKEKLREVEQIPICKD